MRTVAVILLAVISGLVWADGKQALPENLAPRAKVSASSEFSGNYRARNAVSGVVPSEFQPDKDWAVKGTTEESYHPDGFTIVPLARVGGN